MTQADTRHSTPPTNTSANNARSSRRGFLVQAAGVAAGSAALAMALPMPTTSATPQAVPDPILAAIEAHKTAFANVIAILDVHTALERSLPHEKCRSYSTLETEVIRTGDDPRWIECERAVTRAWRAEGDAAIELVNVRPTTLAGVFALIKHACAADPDGETWPRELLSDDGKRSRSWHHFLIENLADVLPRMFGGMA